MNIQIRLPRYDTWSVQNGLSLPSVYEVAGVHLSVLGPVFVKLEGVRVAITRNIRSASL